MSEIKSAKSPNGIQNFAAQFTIETSLYPTVIDVNNMLSARYPETDIEKNSYFVEGLYSGHFRMTDDNDCDMNPDTCVGHVVSPTCSWTTYVENQMYWNNISLASAGPKEPNNGYSYSSMIEIWRAANATRSHVLTWWW